MIDRTKMISFIMVKHVEEHAILLCVVRMPLYLYVLLFLEPAYSSSEIFDETVEWNTGNPVILYSVTSTCGVRRPWTEHSTE